MLGRRLARRRLRLDGWLLTVRTLRGHDVEGVGGDGQASTRGSGRCGSRCAQEVP